MNKDEIKKALECCQDIDCCRKCPYYPNSRCNDMLCKDALNLITEQEKEIEKLKAENEKIYAVRNDLLKENDEKVAAIRDNFIKDLRSGDYRSVGVLDNSAEWQDIKQAKIDVLKELKKRSYTDNDFKDGKWHRYVLTNDIDEMIEELQK